MDQQKELLKELPPAAQDANKARPWSNRGARMREPRTVPGPPRLTSLLQKGLCASSFSPPARVDGIHRDVVANKAVQATWRRRSGRPSGDVHGARVGSKLLPRRSPLTVVLVVPRPSLCQSGGPPSLLHSTTNSEAVLVLDGLQRTSSWPPAGRTARSSTGGRSAAERPGMSPARARRRRLSSPTVRLVGDDEPRHGRRPHRVDGRDGDVHGAAERQRELLQDVASWAAVGSRLVDRNPLPGCASVPQALLQELQLQLEPSRPPIGKLGVLAGHTHPCLSAHASPESGAARGVTLATTCSRWSSALPTMVQTLGLLVGPKQKTSGA